MAQLTDDCFAHGGALLRLDDALRLLGERLSVVAETEELALPDCLGRVLAEDVTCAFDVPPSDNSAVDGYAVFFDDLDPEQEARLPVAGRVTAGHPLQAVAERGTAIRIFTGALMPEGPDTVMMQEDCDLADDGSSVVIRPGIKRGANRRKRGEDIAAGSVVLHAGQRLRPPDLGQAAASGRRSLVVRQALRVALFSTGDELREPGEPLEPGQIYDSNRYGIAGLLRGLGCQVTDLGILADKREAIQAALAAAAERHDLIVTSGGVSVGEEDHVKQAVEALGALHAWRLAIKPGRPIAFGQVGRVPFVGLPGNPAAVMVTFLNIVRPLLLRLLGASELEPQRFAVRTAFAHRKKKDRREWIRASLRRNGGGEIEAVKFPREGAGILSSLVESDGLVELPEEMTHLEEGSMVTFLPFSEVMT
ncbi:MAG: gephyrin-like molybdotransferase Glp [Rhodovibrionaceae bacterium]